MRAVPHLFLGLLLDISIRVQLFLAFLGLGISALAVLLLAAVAVGETAQELSRLGGDAVDPVCVDFDAAIEGAAGLLEVDAVALLEQGHVVEVVDEGKVPRVCGVDLVVRGHLHPLLEVGEEGHALHGRDRGGAWRGILKVVQPGVVFARCCRRLDFVDLPFVEGLARVHAAALFLRIVVERNPSQLARV